MNLHDTALFNGCLTARPGGLHFLLHALHFYAGENIQCYAKRSSPLELELRQFSCSSILYFLPLVISLLLLLLLVAS